MPPPGQPPVGENKVYPSKTSALHSVMPKMKIVEEILIL